MRTLYIECSMGAAGDMLMGALLELHENPSEFIERLNALNIPSVKISAEPSEKCGIWGTHIRVSINGEEEGEHHHHEHGHHHEHAHSTMQSITELIDSLAVSEKVKSDAKAVYALIAEAESHAHRCTVEQVHFHEVGAMDAVADIVGVSMLINELNADKIIVSPISTGSGYVKCAHGILPVPAPATEYLLRGIPSGSGDEDGELCTPTGAALIKHFADGYGKRPVMRTEKTGCGMGTKDFKRANCVRAMIGEEEGESEQITELSCNVDDMTAENMAYAQEMLFEVGALDVYTTAVCMKKSRQGMLLSCICKKEDAKRIAECIFKYTTTIGIREKECSRYKLERESLRVQTQYGEIRVKRSKGYGTERLKAEYEDTARAAREYGITPEEAARAAVSGICE